MNTQQPPRVVVALADVFCANGIELAHDAAEHIVAVVDPVAVLVDVFLKPPKAAIDLGLAAALGVGLGDQIAVGVVGAPAHRRHSAQVQPRLAHAAVAVIELVGALAQGVEGAGAVVAPVVGVADRIVCDKRAAIGVAQLRGQLGPHRLVAVGIGFGHRETEALALLERPEGVARSQREALRRLHTHQAVALIVGGAHGIAQCVRLRDLPVEGVVAVCRFIAYRVALLDEPPLQVIELQRGVPQLRHHRGLAPEEVDARDLGPALGIGLFDLGSQCVVLEAPGVAEGVGVLRRLVEDVVGVAAHRTLQSRLPRRRHRRAVLGELSAARVEGRVGGDEDGVGLVAEEPRLHRAAVAVHPEGAPQPVTLVGGDLVVERVELALDEIAGGEAVGVLRAARLIGGGKGERQRREQRGRVHRTGIQTRIERQHALRIPADEAPGFARHDDVGAVGERCARGGGVGPAPLHDHFVAGAVVVIDLEVVLARGQIGERRGVRRGTGGG